jgi:hypothetical protein
MLQHTGTSVFLLLFLQVGQVADVRTIQKCIIPYGCICTRRCKVPYVSEQRNAVKMVEGFTGSTVPTAGATKTVEPSATQGLSHKEQIKFLYVVLLQVQPPCDPFSEMNCSNLPKFVTA